MAWACACMSSTDPPLRAGAGGEVAGQGAAQRPDVVEVAGDAEGDVEHRRGEDLGQHRGAPGVGGDRLADRGAGQLVRVGLAGAQPQPEAAGCGPGARHRRPGAGRAQGAGDGLLLELVAAREPDLEAGGGRGDRVRHATKACASVPQMPVGGLVGVGRRTGRRAGAPGVSARNSQYRSAGTGRAQILVPAAVVQGPPHQPRGLDPGDQPPVLGGAARLVGPPAFAVEAPAQVGVDLGARLGAVEGQREGGDRAAVEAGADDRAGVGGRRVQQDGLVPPGVADVVGEALHQVGVGADVPGGQVLLERQVGERVPAGGRLGEQAVARDVVEERLAGDRRRRTARAAGPRISRTRSAGRSVAWSRIIW